jgi:hypothetical protein
MTRLWALLALAMVSCGGTTAPGRACRSHADCGWLAQGYCARAEVCTRECDDVRPCPDGSACVLGGGRQVCLPTCTGDGDCLKGFACDVGSATPVCRLVNPLAPPAK